MPTVEKIDRYWTKKGDFPRPWIKETGFKGMQDNPFYHSPAWRRLRKKKKKEKPLCEKCKEKGKLVPTYVIDHIIPINPENGWNTENGKYPNPLDESNLQSLCKSCHYSKMRKQSNKKRIKNVG